MSSDQDEEAVYCVCRGPDDGRFMVCDYCEDVHTSAHFCRLDVINAKTGFMGTVSVSAAEMQKRLMVGYVRAARKKSQDGNANSIKVQNALFAGRSSLKGKQSTVACNALHRGLRTLSSF